MKAMLELLEAESACRDRGFRVAGRLAAAERTRPEEPVDRTLNGAEHGMGRAGVLEEAKLAAPPEHTPKLAQGCLQVRDAAENAHHDRRIEGAVGCRERRGVALHDFDGDRRCLHTLARRGPRSPIRLDREDAVDLRRVVLEGPPVAGADLDHRSAESAQDSAAELAEDRIRPSRLALLEVARKARLLGSVERLLPGQRSISSTR